MRPFLLLLLLCASAAFAEPPAIEFVGVATQDGVTKYAFRDAATGISRWVVVGGAVGDCTLASYDAPTQTAELTRGADRLRVKLSAASSDQSAAAPPAPAQAVAIFRNLHVFVAAAHQHCLETGESVAAAADLIGPGRYIKTLAPIAGEDYSVLTYDQKLPVLTVRTASGATITFDDRPAGPDNASTFYTITPGDSGAKIARAQKLTLADLLALNQGVEFSKLRVGQLLRVRP